MGVSRRSFLVGASASVLAGGCAAVAAGGTGLPRARGSSLRVMTLNVAHGRGRRPSQSAHIGEATFRRNLDAIARVMLRERPDVVALQEAELGSRWAGGFDHVAYLAEAAGYPFVWAAPYRETSRYRYGSALLSNHPLADPGALVFESQGRWDKGMCHACVHCPVEHHRGHAGCELARRRLRIASVHLDFARPSIRRAQALEIARALRRHDEPLVLMGDFNASWNDRSPVQLLARELDLDTWAPSAETPTYPSARRRLDWILVCPGLRMEQHVILTSDRLSDHYAVMADLALGA